MTDRSKLLSILVRAPETGYRLQDVYKIVFPNSGPNGWSKFRRALDGFDGLPIWQDAGRIGILQTGKRRYMPMDLEVIKREL
jgi:hypothetical protein